jgi:hypothetical protein
MRAVWVLLAGAALAVSANGQADATLRVDFSNPGLIPSNWTLTLHPDGSGHFHAERGTAKGDPEEAVEPVKVDRDIRLSSRFTASAFATVRDHHLLQTNCESHMKVAFQGWKKLTYTGPDGEGSCEFNYSKDKEIQSLGESFVAIASTLVEGARLELLLQHEPLGLDKELEFLTEAARDGRVQQLCAIRGILQKLEDDPDVMERVRKRASILLVQSSK